jgi:hypothetical protein
VHGTLLDVLIVLGAAKIAAEGSERIGVPAVVGEIVAGVVTGPSLLSLMTSGEVLRTLSELGVILLQVGLEIDLGDLGAVGKSSSWSQCGEARPGHDGERDAGRSGRHHGAVRIRAAVGRGRDRNHRRSAGHRGHLG